MDFILINLQYDPTAAMLVWADGLLKANTDRRAIVVSHGILNTNDAFTSQNRYFCCFEAQRQSLFDAVRAYAFQ